MLLTSGIDGVKGDGIREEKNVAGYYGDVMSQATVTAAACEQRLTQADAK